jgi:hypothetical protein
VRESNPLTLADFPQPLFIGGIVPKVVHMALNPQAGGAQDLREFLAEVAVCEKDRPRVHAARS